MARRPQRRLRSLVRPLLTALAPLLAGALRLLAATWRLRVEGADPFASHPPAHRLGALWHRNLLVAAGVFRDRGVFVPVSRSADGDLISAAMLRLGLASPPRGSSRRGGVPLLRQLVRLIEAGEVVGILTDGPVGPAEVSKPGVVQLAKLAGEPVLPIALSARPCLRFGSWDRMLLPLPFARVLCLFGEPLAVAADARGPALEALRGELDARLGALTREAERRC